MTTNVTLDHPAVMAFLGFAADDSVELLGSGVLVGSRTILTSGHLVRSQIAARDLRWYSRHQGILMVKTDGISHPPLDQEEAESHVQSDLVLIRLRHRVRGLEPLPVTFESPQVGTRLAIAGFGGVNPGAFENRTTEVWDGAGLQLPGLRAVDRVGPLRRGDSGSPALVEGTDGLQVAGIFTNFNFGGIKVVTTFELNSVRNWFEETLARFETAGSAPSRPLKVQAHAEELRVLLSAGGMKSHDFHVEKGAHRMSVAVNATPRLGLARPGLEVRLLYGNKLIERRLPSQFRSFWLLKNHRELHRRLKPGAWRLEVTTETACDYEVHWTVYGPA